GYVACPGVRPVPTRRSSDLGPLLAMVAATVVVAVFDLPGVATIESTFGEIPRALPKLQAPEMDFDRIVLLLPSAFTIAMLGAIRSEEHTSELQSRENLVCRL